MNSDPASYHHSETLSDGQTIRLRAIQPNDRERLREEFLKLSKATVRDRFFSVKMDLTPKELTYFTEVDFDHHVALVAELESAATQSCTTPSGTTYTPVAVGRLVRQSGQPDHCEIAITVTDAMQGHGIGKILLNQLIDCARKLGVRHMDASVMADNTRMMKLIRKTGLPFKSQLQDGINTISLSLHT
jgi:GNAT superfamily N-acetyltransferase